MRKLMLAAGLGVLVTSGALAQDKAATTIQVVAFATVETPPDVATISYRVRGEGKTANDATRAMVARKAAIEAGLGALEGIKIDARTGDINIEEVRSTACRGEEDDDSPRLSTGPCAIIGYLATIRVTLRVTPVGQAGTLAGIAAREGASGVEASDFELLDERAARQRATVAAVANGTSQAQAIAAASGGTLGRLIRVTDNESSGDEDAIVVVSGYQRAPAPEAVQVDIAPKPVRTLARLTLVFEILR
jgi:uncharacterized protein YggE